MHHRGYEVWITCDGQPVQEYQAKVEGDDGKTMACFIPSESGKTFAIHWQDGIFGDYLLIEFVLDGNKLGHASLCLPGQSGQRAGAMTSADVEQPFQFANLQTTDDEELLGGISNNADLGSIKVMLKRVHGHCTKIPYVPATFNPIGAVHERSKKAGAHTVSLGKGTRITNQPHQFLEIRESIDPREGYIAAFIFRYRPRDLLQAQGIISASAQPQPQAGPSRLVPKTEKKRPYGASENGQPSKRPKTEPGLARANLGVIDLSDDEQPRPKKVKAEPRRSPKRALGDPNDVIDLTLDD